MARRKKAEGERPRTPPKQEASVGARPDVDNSAKIPPFQAKAAQSPSDPGPIHDHYGVCGQQVKAHGVVHDAEVLAPLRCEQVREIAEGACDEARKALAKLASDAEVTVDVDAIVRRARVLFEAEAAAARFFTIDGVVRRLLWWTQSEFKNHLKALQRTQCRELRNAEPLPLDTVLEFENWYFEVRRAGGKITAFSLSGQNMLVLQGSGGATAINFGSTLWTSPQAVWSWPPPTALDSDNYTVAVSGNTIMMSSPVATNPAVSVTKLFTPDLVDRSIVIEYTVTNRGTSTISVAVGVAQ